MHRIAVILLNLTILFIAGGSLTAQGDEHPYHLSTSTYLGDISDDNEVMGVRVLSDGTVVVAALIGETQPRDRATGQPVTPILLNGATSQTTGVILRLSSDGRNILSLTRFADDIEDLEIDGDDRLYVAAGAGGLIVLNASADSILELRQVGEHVQRVTTSPLHVATLVPDSINNAESTPGPGQITFFTRSGMVEQWRVNGLRNTMDIAIDDASQTVAHIGWRQASSWQENGSGSLPVQISYLRGLDFNGLEKWKNYDWSTNPDIDGLPSEFDPATGIVKITNPRFLNSTGQPTGELDDLGRPLYGYVNNMADTRGYRLTRGEDGYFYGGFEAAGGNHIFRSLGSNDVTEPDFRQSAASAGGDFFNSFINTGASHKTYIARFEPSTGHHLLGNQFSTLVDRDGSQGANTLRLKQGGIFVDAESRLYFAGSAASGLPLPGNNVGSPMQEQISLEPFGVGSNEGGAYVWVVDSDMATRLFVGRTSNGSTRAIHVRTPNGATSPIIAWGGRAELTRPMHVFQALQPQPGYGTDDGFIVVLGDTPTGGTDSSIVFSYGDADYAAVDTRLRGTDPDERTDTVDGQSVTITEYAYSETLPLSPPAPGYTGPEFFGGVRAIHRDPASTGFSGNSYSGSETNLRVQRSDTRSQALYFFPRESIPGLQADDSLSFDGDSYLMLNGGSGGFITGGRWLVRDGDTFYVSEESTSGRILAFTSSLDHGQWAPLDSNPQDTLDFEIDETAFEPKVFSDITAVGFLQYRPEYTGSRFTSNWYGFEASLALNVESNQPPVPVASSDASAVLQAPVTVNFDGSSSNDPDGEITFIRWTSGDGTEIAGNTFSHTYEAAGNYTASLTVWDDKLVERVDEIALSIVSPQAPNPERVVAAWGGELPSSNFRYGANDTSQLDLDGDGDSDDIRRGTGYGEEVPVVNRLSQRGTKVHGGIWLSILNGDKDFAAQGSSGSDFQIRVTGSDSKPIAMHGVLIIQKESFLGDASGATVGLSQGDGFHMLGIDKFGKMSPLRWLVRDGNTYYVSEAVIDRDNPSFTIPADNDHGRWAVWDPNEVADHLNFDSSAAVFTTRFFSDITAYGVVIDNDTYADARIWFSFDELVFEGSPLEIQPGDPDEPPVTSILAPADASTFESGDTITLNGQALQGDDSLNDSFLQWNSSLDGPLGGGSTLMLSELSAGLHTITLTAVNVSGFTSSDSIDIEVLPAPQAPVVLTQSEDQERFENSSVELSASFTASPGIGSYQWFKDGVAVSNTSRISGATTATLIITDATLVDAGSYTLEATNSLGSGATNPITLTIVETASLSLLLDFGNKVDDPSGNWNTIAGEGVHENLINALTGDVVPGFRLENVNTGGSGLQLSNATETWGARTVAPEWSVPLALSDRMWISNGDSATLRLSNLQAGQLYDIEIASSFAGSGSAGANPGVFQVVGASGPVEGLNPHTEVNLGTEIYWTSRGPDDGGDENSTEGWMRWSGVQADVSGEIQILLWAPTDSLSRVSVNAMRLISSDSNSSGPEVSTLEDWRLWHYGVSENSGNAANGASPLGDGVPNLIKYALGMDPHVKASPGRIMDLQRDSEGLHIRMGIPEATQRSDIDYLVEYSGNLTDWATIAKALGQGAFTRETGVAFGVPERVNDDVLVPLTDDSLTSGFFRLNFQKVER
jgi:hypothetical protein